MPCRCCNAVKPPKGIKLHDSPNDEAINSHLRLAAHLINNKYSHDEYDSYAWQKEWITAFTHHLMGCPEKNNEHI